MIIIVLKVVAMVIVSDNGSFLKVNFPSVSPYVRSLFIFLSIQPSVGRPMSVCSFIHSITRSSSVHLYLHPYNHSIIHTSFLLSVLSPVLLCLHPSNHSIIHPSVLLSVLSSDHPSDHLPAHALFYSYLIAKTSGNMRLAYLQMTNLSVPL